MALHGHTPGEAVVRCSESFDFFMALLAEAAVVDGGQHGADVSRYRDLDTQSRKGLPNIDVQARQGACHRGSRPQSRHTEDGNLRLTRVKRVSRLLAMHYQRMYQFTAPVSAGKSTTMSILAGLLGRTRGSVLFEGGVERPPLGSIGLVPQKNVLFPELTCYQTLRVWRAIKPLSDSAEEEDIEQLLKDCDLGKKIHYNANALSGGQKRKLQLAIGLVGGSKSASSLI